jgi:hypothetical protein
MEIKRNSSEPSRKAPAEYFTGAVRIPWFQARNNHPLTLTIMLATN